MIKMRRIIFSALLALCVAGCASVPQREPFDKEHLDTMHNVAIFVRDLRIEGKTSGLPWEKAKLYQTPVVYYYTPRSGSSTEAPVSKNVSVSVSVSFGPSMLIDQVRTNRLQSFIKDYHIQDNLMSEFREEFKKIKNVKIPDSEEIEKLYKNHYAQVLDKLEFWTAISYQSEFNNFKTDLSKILCADTLILIDIGLWGFRRASFLEFPTTRGNFMMMVSYDIIRLSDGWTLFNNDISVDFTESSFKKKNLNLELFLKGDEPIIFQTLQELIETVVVQIVKDLKG